MSQKTSITFEQFIFLAIFALALTLRLGALGASPLIELEAEQALRAYQLAQGEHVALGDSAAYVLLTGLTFTFLGSNEFLARLWPAFFGSLLVLVPYGMRAALGRKAALLLAFGLAIAPSFVAISRQASGVMLGVVLPIFAFLVWTRGLSIPAGVFAAFALLSGPVFYVGLLSLSLAWALLTLLGRSDDLRAWLIPQNNYAPQANWRLALIALGVTLIFGATFFLRVPEGFSALGSAVSGFFTAWSQPAGIPIPYLLLALVAYNLPVLAFGTLASARAWSQSDALGRSLSLWALAALMVAFAYPGRQPADLLWALLPFWVLSAMEFSRYLRLSEEYKVAIVGVFALTLLLFAFIWLNTAGASRFDLITNEFRRYLFVVGGVVVLGALALFLVAFGWSKQVAGLGFAWALGLASVLFLLSSTVRLASPYLSKDYEIVSPGFAAGQSILLMDSLTSLSEWQTGQSNNLEVVIQNESKSLLWELRDWPKARLASALAVEDQPPVILTAGLETQPSQLTAYRGQSFAWGAERAWENALPPNLLAWLLFREAPTRSQYLILWARADLFPSNLESAAQDQENGAASSGQ